LETHILSGDGLNFACWTRLDSGHLIACLPDEFDSRLVCGGEARSAVTPARLRVNANENDSQEGGSFCRDFVATDHQLAHARCRRGTIASACEGPAHGRRIDPVELKSGSVFQAVKSNTFAMGVCPSGVTPYMGVFPSDAPDQFRITSWRDPQLAQAGLSAPQLLELDYLDSIEDHATVIGQSLTRLGCQSASNFDPGSNCNLDPVCPSALRRP
jgi:hypothetical protein